MEFLFEGHKWVFTMHIFVGPLLSLIAYLCHSETKGFNNYGEFINGLLIAQMCLGFIVFLYHGYRLAQNNELI